MRLGDLLLAAVIAASMLVWLNSRVTFWSVGGDTEEYEELSVAITGGRLFERPPPNQLEYGLYKRTPGFPLLLALGRAFFPDDPLNGLRLGHTAVSVFALCLLAAAFKSQMPLTLVALALVVPVVQMSYFFTGFMSEWTCFNLVLSHIAIALLCLRSGSLGSLFALALVNSLLVLVHPSFVTTPPLCWLLGWFRFRGRRAKAAAVLLAGLLPVVIWCSINWVRVGYFTITPYGSTATFSIFSLIGRATVDPADPPLLKDFIERANSETDLASDEELREARSLTSQPKLLRLYVQKNLFLDRFGADTNWSMLERRQLTGTYVLRAFTASIDRYLKFLGHSVIGIFRSWALVIPATLAIAFCWRRTGRHPALCGTLVWFAAFHLVHVLCVIAVTPVAGRYYSVTFYPLLFGLILAVMRFGFDIVHRR